MHVELTETNSRGDSQMAFVDRSHGSALGYISSSCLSAI